MGTEKGDSLLEPHQRIKQLEVQLEARDEEIDQLRSRIENQQSLLAHRWQCIERLQQERDELRKHNSQLSSKLAEVTRRNSVSSGASPFKRSMTRISTSNSSLQGQPSTPQNEDLPALPPRGSASSPSLPTPLPSTPLLTHQSSTDSNGKQPPNEDDSETDYSDMDAEEKEREKARVRRNTKRLSKQRQKRLRETGTQLTPQRRSGSSAIDINRSFSPPLDDRPSLVSSSPPRGSSSPKRSSPNGSPPKVSLAHRLLHGSSEPHLTRIEEERSRSPDGVVTVTSLQQEGKVPNGDVVHPYTPLKKHSSSDDVFLTADTNVVSSKVSWSAGALDSPQGFEESTDLTDFDSSLEVSCAAKSPVKSSLKSPAHQKSFGISFTPPADLRKVRELSGSQGSLDNEELDVVGGLKVKSSVGSIRERTNTISAIGKHVELGGRTSRKARKLRKGTAKVRRQNSLNNLRREQSAFLRDLELISPDMEAKIREKICSAIGAKYGGLRRATRAATTIQRAYREYKLRKRFEEIRREKREMTMSLNYTTRRPSMIRKRQPGYRREFSVPEVRSADPYTRIKQTTKKLGQERPSHMTSRLHLKKQKRNELAESPRPTKDHKRWSTSPEKELEVEKVPEIVTEVCTVLVEEDELRATPDLVTIEGVCLDESSTDPDHKDLPTSFSSDELLSVSRPVSIFPMQSSASLQECTPGEGKGREGGEWKKSRKRALSTSTVRKKTNIGVSHFNRKPMKGIQYLVLEGVLEDDPQAVAEFLMGGTHKLSKEKIGEFLGEINSDFNMAVLECVTEMLSVQTTSIDEALRQFQQTFRMPGEAQKIDKIMQAFALEYYKQNKGEPIRSEDAAYILSFAIMMLHTSLHNRSVKSHQRTTKKQWLSMNRGVNEGGDFPESFLLEIYDRIQKTEITTGQDHTQEVLAIERSLTGPNPPKLVTPQRHVLHKVQVIEVIDLSSRPAFGRSRHRRALFIFNDLVIVCKKRGNDQFQCRGSFSLLNAVALNFETHHYKHGVQFYSSLDSKAKFQCNCDSQADRQLLLQKLNDAVRDLKELEKERITELGTTLGKKTIEGTTRQRLQSGAGDLLSSTDLSVRTMPRENKGHVRGVGDLVMTSRSTRSLPPGFATPKRSPKKKNKKMASKQHPAGDLLTIREDRSSKDSGFDSQQTTPVTSPSPTSTKSKSPAHSPITLTPPTTATTATATSVTLVHSSSPSSSLALPTTTPPRSRSYNSIKTLTVIPSPNTPPRSPSTGNFRHASLTEPSPKKDKAKTKKDVTHPSRKSRFASLSVTFNKHKVGKSRSLSPYRADEGKDLGREQSASPPDYFTRSSDS